MRVTTTHDSVSWRTGFEVGRRGDPYVIPAEIADRPAFTAGFIEGVAWRIHDMVGR